jgi:hypothetical protein
MEQIKIISVEYRDSFIKVIVEHDGSKYEGLLLKSGNANQEG